MKNLVLGPTFVLHANGTPEAVAAQLGAWIESQTCPFVGGRQGVHLQLAIPPVQRHRWSPWLTIEVRNTMPMPQLPATLTGPDAAAAEVFGRFNPSPSIWTGYMLASLALVTIIVAAAMWGVIQLMMDRWPTAMLLVPACVAVMAMMWAVSAAGQRLAADEMARMRDAVERVVGA